MNFTLVSRAYVIDAYGFDNMALIIASVDILKALKIWLLLKICKLNVIIYIYIYASLVFLCRVVKSLCDDCFFFFYLK